MTKKKQTNKSVVDLTLPATIANRGAQPKNNQPQKKRRNRGKPPNKAPQPPVAPEPPLQQDQAKTLTYGDNRQSYGRRVARGNIVRTALRQCPNVSAHGAEWVMKAYDCLEAEEGLCEGHKVPDGAFKNSLVGEMRHLVYLRPPRQTASAIPLDGNNWSVFVWSPALLRTAAFIIASLDGADISALHMKLACATWNDLEDYKAADYPEWVQVDDEATLFLQRIRFPILDTLPVPVGGVSPVWASYRFAADGIRIEWNAPSLLDQGGVTAVQVAANNVTRSSYEGLEPDGRVLVQGAYGLIVDDGEFFLNTPWGLVNLSAPDGTVSTAITVNFPATMGTLQNAITAELATGDLLRLRYLPDSSPATLSGLLVIERALAATPTIFDPLPGRNVRINGINNVNVGLNFKVSPLDIMAGHPQINAIAVPAFDTSGMLFQGAPGAVQAIAHDSHGIDVVKSPWQPFLFASSGQKYAPVRLITDNMSPEALSSVETGINQFADSYDLNFGNAFVQIVGMSSSNYPMLSFRRVIEVVVNPINVFAIFQTQAAPKDMVAIMVADCLKDQMPHAFNAKTKGLGGLISTILDLVNQVPGGSLVSGVVSNIVGSVLGSIGGLSELPYQGKGRIRARQRALGSRFGT